MAQGKVSYIYQASLYKKKSQQTRVEKAHPGQEFIDVGGLAREP